jgi:hypothetical protein
VKRRPPRCQRGPHAPPCGHEPPRLRRARLSLWRFNDEGVAASDQARLLDPLKLVSKPYLVQEDTDRLVSKYGPDERDKEGFSFLIKRSAAKKVLFKVELCEVANVGDDPSWLDYRWDSVCPEPADDTRHTDVTLSRLPGRSVAK